jgi:uncharacterized protein (TIGR03437 family)
MFNLKRSQGDESQARIRRRVSLLGSMIGALLAAAGGFLGHSSQAQEDESVVMVSSASYDRAGLAPGSLATAFGENLATGTASAADEDPVKPGVQLPTILSGTTVRVNGAAAPLLFVSPKQVNFVIPESVAASANESDFIPYEISSGTGAVSSGKMLINAVAPAIFCMNGDGQGNPAAYLVRVKDDQNKIERLIDQDPMTGRPVFKPVNFGDVSPVNNERIFLVLFLSGIRKAADPNQDGNQNESIVVSLNGFDFKPVFAGPQPDFTSLDQINVELPRKFLGAPQFEIEIRGGVNSNRVTVPLVVPPLTEARWRASGLEGQDVHALISAGTTLIAGATKGIFRSTEDGTGWVESPYSFPTDEKKRRALRLLNGSGNGRLIAGTDGEGIWYSGEPATSWTRSSKEFGSPIQNERALALAENQRMRFAGTATNGVFRTPITTTEKWTSSGLTGQRIAAMLASDDRTFAATESNGLMSTSNDGETWTRVEGGLPADVKVLTMTLRGQTVLAGTTTGLWRSNDSGVSWAKLLLPEERAVNAVLMDDTNLIVGLAGGGVLISTNDGRAWKALNDGLTNEDVLSLHHSGGKLFAGTKDGVFTADFVRVPNQPPSAEAQTVALNEDTSAPITLAGADPDGDPLAYKVLSFPTHGRLDGIAPNLTYVPFPNYAGKDSFSFIVRDGVVGSAIAVVAIDVAPVNDPIELSVVGTENSVIGGFVRIEIRAVDPDGGPVTVVAASLPDGAIFDQGGDQSRATVKWLPTTPGDFTFRFAAMQSGEGNVTKDFKVAVTMQQPSETWAEVPLYTTKSVKSVLAIGAKIFVALAGVGSDTTAALLRSLDNGRTWKRVGDGAPVNVATYTLIKGGEALYLTCSEGLYRSNDDGETWTNISRNKGLPEDGRSLALAALGNKLVAWSPTRIFLSSDAGEAWAEATNRLPIIPSGSSVEPGGVILSAAVSPGAVLVSLSTGITPTSPITFRSIDDGARWEPANQGMSGPYSVSSFLLEGNRLYGANAFYLNYSDDEGATWNALSPPDRRPVIFNGLVADGTTGFFLVAYGSGEIQRSVDNGVSWRQNASIPGEIVRSISLGGSSIFAVTQNDRLFVHPR